MPYFGKEPVSSPSQTIGTGAAEDIKILFDGNAVDYHIGLDDTADDLVIGKGSALGTTTHMSFTEDGVVSMPLQPGCWVRRASVQSINHATETTVNWDTEEYDTNNDFDNSTNYRFTAPEDGFYLALAHVSFNIAQDKYIALDFRINGTQKSIINNASAVANHTTTTVTGIFNLDATDYLYLQAYHVHGSALNLTAGVAWSQMHVHKLA